MRVRMRVPDDLHTKHTQKYGFISLFVFVFCFFGCFCLFVFCFVFFLFSYFLIIFYYYLVLLLNIPIQRRVLELDARAMQQRILRLLHHRRHQVQLCEIRKKLKAAYKAQRGMKNIKGMKNEFRSHTKMC